MRNELIIYRWNEGGKHLKTVDYFDHAREEARMAELLGGESRKRADEARDFLRKAREVVNGARGAPQRLRRDEKRFHKAEDAYQLLWQRQVGKD